MKEIKLTDGKTAQVDNEDYEWLNQYKWRAEKHKNTYYAVTNMIVNGEMRKVAMHDLIMSFVNKHN
jgi:hypothetical protein